MKISLLILVAFLCGGCFVLDELDNGAAIMEAHTPKSARAKAETASKSSDGTPKSARERLNEYYAKQRSLAPVTTTTADPDDAVGRCRIRGVTHFTRRSDCRLRGGTFL